jgi:formate hydrogenlyase subunit 3/multisubunit Na+/H+ antiporter MnhD subunit
MPGASAVEIVSTGGGVLLPLAVLVPFIGVLAGFVLGGRNAQRVAMVTLLAGFAISLAMAAAMLRLGESLVYVLGGWTPPLGVALRADGLSLVMMLAVPIVVAGITLYARADFGTSPGELERRASLTFWTLLLAIWGSLNLVFVSGDLFTLYVALELLTFAAVPLVSLDGKGETLRSALRYLVYALLGSVFYLLGTVLMYGGYGTLDISLLAGLVRPDAVTLVAAALLTAGLLAKTALFPLHLWLPPAHAGAPAAASAVLSGLVIKGSWFLVVRLWFDVFPGVVTFSAAQLLGALGAAAILVGNVVALRQERLKLLVAYSTVAQIGYLFLMFPLAFDIGAGALVRSDALTGGMLQAISHATAKAAMFMAAGLVYHAHGHDRIAELGGLARALPVTVLSFAIAGLALMGLPPSGAYAAKKLLLGAAAGSGQWWWEVVLQAGALLTASYVVLVLANALAPARKASAPQARVSRLGEATALGLAIVSLVLGFAATGPTPLDAVSNPLALSELASAAAILLGGGVIAVALANQLPPLAAKSAVASLVDPVRPLTTLAGALFVRVDAWLRQWAVAGLSLLAVAIALGLAMVAGR